LCKFFLAKIKKKSKLKKKQKTNQMASEFKQSRFFDELIEEKIKEKTDGNFLTALIKIAKKEFSNYLEAYNPSRNEIYVFKLVLLYILLNKYGYVDQDLTNVHFLCDQSSSGTCTMEEFINILRKYYLMKINASVDRSFPIQLVKETKEEVNFVKRGTPEEAKYASFILFPKAKEEEEETKIIKKCGFSVQDKIIGKGASGEVYLSPDSKQAVKILEKDWDKYLGLNPEQLNEILYQSSFDNPYVTPINNVRLECGNYEASRSNPFAINFDDQDYRNYQSSSNKMAIVMPAAISDLRNLFKTNEKWNFSIDNPITSGVKELRFKFAHDMLCGLNYLHSRNILSLDIKPQNMLLFRDNSAYGIRLALSDFGFSQHRKGDKVTRGANSIVTALYRDPRLTCGLVSNDYDTEVDIWAIGLTLIDLFFGFSIPWFDEDDQTKSSAKLILQQLYPGSDFIAELLTKSKSPELSHWCLAIIQNNDIRGKKLPTSLEPIIPYREFFIKVYYTPEEYRNIWQVIDSCLQFDKRKRATAQELLMMPLFSGFEEKCLYPSINEDEFKFKKDEQFDYLLEKNDIPPNVENLTRFILEELRKEGSLWPKNVNKDDYRLTIATDIAANIALKYYGYEPENYQDEDMTPYEGDILDVLGTDFIKRYVSTL
jgi:serine/threonine protein kinase